MEDQTLGTPPETSQEEKPVKKWGKEDIVEAEDLEKVMEAYHKAVKDKGKYSPLSEFQTSVAERLTQIGETEKSFQFTVLAEQTKNTERFQGAIESMGIMIDEHSKLPGRIENVLAENLRHVNDLPRELRNSMESFAHSTRAITTAASTIEHSADKINTASHRMGN